MGRATDAYLEAHRAHLGLRSYEEIQQEIWGSVGSLYVAVPISCYNMVVRMLREDKIKVMKSLKYDCMRQHRYMLVVWGRKITVDDWCRYGF